jgi:DNA-binding PadR family transcriptional regulator
MLAATEAHSPFSPAALQILLALANHDLHGYGIIQAVSVQSEGHIKIGSGTLYDNLKRFMDQGLVSDLPPTSGDSKRLYRLTRAGHSALSIEIARLEKVIKDARRRVPGLRPTRTI